MRLSLIFICLLIPVHLWLSSFLIESKSVFDAKYSYEAAVSGNLLRLTSTEFKSLMADKILLDGIFYLGRLLADKQNTASVDWDYFGGLASSAVELDPYFFDTYYFASSMLAWNAARPYEAAELLRRAVTYRPRDHRLLFNLGFIYYYFLDDKASAADFMQKAAREEGAPPFYANLAARFAFDTGSHETAAAFLVAVIEQTENESLRLVYEKRLTALVGAMELERALNIYAEKTGKSAAELSELISYGILSSLPQDPYGGEYYIGKDGRVSTTSKFAEEN